MNSIFKALVDPTRRQVWQMLRAGPMTAGALADAFDEGCQAAFPKS